MASSYIQWIITASKRLAGHQSLLWGRWYGREVRRCALHHWQYGGTSVRRTAALLRAWLGHQERWQRWRPLAPAPAEADRCTLGASTVQRWLNEAGEQARQTVRGQLAGGPPPGAPATQRPGGRPGG